MTKSLRFALITLLILILACAGVYWFIGYRKTQQLNHQLVTLSHNLSQKRTWQTRMQTEQAILNLIEQSNIRHYRWLGLHQVNDVYHQINQQYTADLRQHFVPYLHRLTVSILNKQSNLNALALYDAAKAYLLATQNQHQNTAFQRNWYRQHIAKKYYPALDQVIEQGLLLWPGNQAYIKRTRAKFQDLSPADISFLVIQGYYPNHLSPVSFRLALPKSIDTSGLAIPELYSNQLFFPVYQKQIPALAPQAAHGDWITGTIAQSWKDRGEKQLLIEHTQAEYLLQYQLHWQQLMQKIHLQPMHDLASMSELIQQLQQPNSAIWQLLTTINNNATLYQNKATPMSNFLGKNRGYQGFQAALYTLKQQVDSIAHNKNPYAASFAFTAGRMNQPHQRDDLSLSLAVAKQLPQPMSQWLTQIAHRFWHISLQQSKTYIQAQWQKQILHPYRAFIAARYPVFSYAKAEINLKQFQHFFAPKGTLDGFVQHYLSPYISHSNHHWQKKTLDGEQLSLSKDHLDMLTRGALIRDMFFHDGSHQANAQFFLNTPLLAPHTQRAIINIAGQMYTVSDEKTADQQFSWPGPNPGFVTIQLTSDQGKSTTKTYTGTWAWFHALDHSRLRTTDKLNQYHLILQLGHQAAEYTLLTEDIINPFIPHVLAQFRAPEKI